MPPKEIVAAPIPDKDLRQLIEQQVKDALAQAQGADLIPKGRPYPEEYDLVPYPKGFVPPSFHVFNGSGNPKQHLAHFRASCCNAGGSDALLFRQFVSSLAGVAFDWYADLPSGSVKTFPELEALFLKRFFGMEQHITVGDLVVAQQRQGESLVDYIVRWRNLSARCEPQLQEQHAVEILLKNIHGPVAFLLKGFTIQTFQKLLKKAASLSEEASQLSFLKDQSTSDPRRQPQAKKQAERKAAQVSAVARGKQPMAAQPERQPPKSSPPPDVQFRPPQPYQPRPHQQ